MFEEVARQILAQKRASMTGEYFERGRTVRFANKLRISFHFPFILSILRSRDKVTAALAPGVEILAPSDQSQPEKREEENNFRSISRRIRSVRTKSLAIRKSTKRSKSVPVHFAAGETGGKKPFKFCSIL